MHQHTISQPYTSSNGAICKSIHINLHTTIIQCTASWSSLYCNCRKAIHHHHNHQILKREFHINDVPIAVRIGSDYPTVDAPSAHAINIRINIRGKGYEVIKPYEAWGRYYHQPEHHHNSSSIMHQTNFWPTRNDRAVESPGRGGWQPFSHHEWDDRRLLYHP